MRANNGNWKGVARGIGTKAKRVWIHRHRGKKVLREGMVSDAGHEKKSSGMRTGKRALPLPAGKPSVPSTGQSSLMVWQGHGVVSVH